MHIKGLVAPGNLEGAQADAVQRHLQWADPAAPGGAYSEALEWRAVVEAIGDVAPKAYRINTQRGVRQPAAPVMSSDTTWRRDAT